MISHTYRCIFIHIPRCGGTSIEEWIQGQDQWKIDPARKHLLASQARNLYAPYWDSYFKFAFVRNPLPRTLSCLAAYPEHFGLRLLLAGEVDFAGYHALFGRDVVVEHDYRFYRREDLVASRHQPGSVYGNILDEEVDFVGRLENLSADTDFIRERLEIPFGFAKHAEARRREPPRVSTKTADAVRSLYKSDYARFGLAD